MSGRRGYVVTSLLGGEDVLTAPTPPAQGAPSPSGTTSVSLTWTHPGAPASGITYALTATDTSTGSAVTPSSGSGLGPYVLPTSNGQEIVVTLAVTRTSDNQAARSLPYYVAVEASPALSWAAPAATAVAAGNTSAVLTWTTPTGGTAPYTYSSPSVVYDSQGASTTVSLSTSGAGAGATTASGLVNGQVVILQRSLTDADGTPLSVQGVVSVGAASATLTLASAPAAVTRPAGSTTATIGTWGAATGGVGPYSYVVTEISDRGTTVGGSGLGPWTAAGLTDGQAYAYLMTATDSLGAIGLSVVTVTVAQGDGGWVEMDRISFTDADWTAFSSSDATVSTTAWQHTLLAADGVTPRAYVLNTSSQARTLSISPSGSGLTLVNGGTTALPQVSVWPVGWESLRGGSREDAWMVEALVEGEEPTGTATFVHIAGITPSVASTPGGTGSLVGLRVINTSSSTRVNAVSYVSSVQEVAVRTIAPGSSRTWRYSMQVVIADSRRHPEYLTYDADDFCAPQSGLRVQPQQSSTTMTIGNNPTSAAWFGTSIGGRTKILLYHDGSATVGSAVRLLGLRLLRKPNGSL